MDAICLPYKSLVTTRMGPMQIGDLVGRKFPIEVLSFNHNTAALEWKMVTHWFDNPAQPLIEIHTSHGYNIRSTGGHPVYIEGVGYVRAEEVKLGDRVKVLSALPKGNYADRKKREVLRQEMLRRISAVTSIAMSALRSGLQKKSVESAWRFVQHEMLRGSQEKTKFLPGLRKANILGVALKVQGLLSQGAEKIGRATLYSLREYDLSFAWTNRRLQQDSWGFLQPKMFWGLRSWQGESLICERERKSEISSGISSDAAKNFGSRKWMLFSLWDSAKKAGCASFRWRSRKQSSIKSDDSLPNMPRESAWEIGGQFMVSSDVVVRIDRSIPNSANTYNIEVDGNNNYFADGILTHNCEHLEAITKGQITRLLINVPPGTMKSLSSAVLWPAWEWGPMNLGHIRFIGASHEAGLATRDSMKMRRLVTSEWYQRLWPLELTSDQNEKTYVENTKTGWRQACAVKSMTGRRGDRVCWDDPHSVEDAHSKAALDEANRVFRETLPTRLNNPDSSAIIIDMQRLSAKDVSGEILSSDLGYVHLCLPMEWEGPRKKTIIGFQDPRTKVGELLFPARFPREVVERDKKIMGEYAVAGQFQQRPSPAGGGILKSEHFKLWKAADPLPDLFYVLQSYDTAFTEKTTGDPTGCLVFGIGEHKSGQRFAIILDAWCEHLGYPSLRKKVMDDWKAEYGGVKDDVMHPSRRADAILIEDKGSGQSLLQDLRLSNIPCRGYNPGKADKVARAHIVAPLLESGLVYVLESKREPGKPVTWVRPALTQFEEFPNGEHDEYPDCLSQGLIFLRDSNFLQLDFIPPEDPDEIDYHEQRKHRGNPYAR